LYWKLGLDFEQMCRKRDESNVIQTFECPQSFVSSEKNSVMDSLLKLSIDVNGAKEVKIFLDWVIGPKIKLFQTECQYWLCHIIEY
jgi:hypothetical protein